MPFSSCKTMGLPSRYSYRIKNGTFALAPKGVYCEDISQSRQLDTLSALEGQKL